MKLRIQLGLLATIFISVGILGFGVVLGPIFNFEPPGLRAALLTGVISGFIYAALPLRPDRRSK